MKKVFLLLISILFILCADAQFTIQQSLGSKATLITVKGGLLIDSVIVPAHFSDTDAANLGPTPKFYPGNIIRTGNNLWMRSDDALSWIQINGGGGGGSDGNNYPTSFSFNTSTGVLTLNRSGLSAITIDLDGRYIESESDPSALKTAGDLSPLFTTSEGSNNLTFSLNTQSANLVFAGPPSGGAAGPTFRSLVASDIPALSYLSNITGLITQGTNITITGSGTGGSPYIINSSAGSTVFNKSVTGFNVFDESDSKVKKFDNGRYIIYDTTDKLVTPKLATFPRSSLSYAGGSPLIQQVAWQRITADCGLTYTDGVIRVIVNDTLFVFGGTDGITTTDSIHYWNGSTFLPYSVKWPYALANVTSIKAKYPGDYNYVFGSTSIGDGHTQTVIRFKDFQHLETMTTTAEYGDRKGFLALRDEMGNLYIFGGQTANISGFNTNDVWMSTAQSGGKNWTQVQTGLSWVGGMIYNSGDERDGYAYIFNAGTTSNSGGVNVYSVVCKKIAFENIIGGENKWVDLPNSPAELDSAIFASARTFKSNIYFGFGGHGNPGVNGKTLCFMDKNDRWHHMWRYEGIDTGAVIFGETHATGFIVWGEAMYAGPGSSQHELWKLQDTTFLQSTSVAQIFGVNRNFKFSEGSTGDGVIGIGVIKGSYSSSTSYIQRTTSTPQSYTLYDNELGEWWAGILNAANSTINTDVVASTGRMIRLKDDGNVYIYPSTTSASNYFNFATNGFLDINHSANPGIKFRENGNLKYQQYVASGHMHFYNPDLGQDALVLDANNVATFDAYSGFTNNDKTLDIIRGYAQMPRLKLTDLQAGDTSMQILMHSTSNNHTYTLSKADLLAGIGVNIYNSDGTQSDAARAYTMSSNQTLNFNQGSVNNFLQLSSSDNPYFYTNYQGTNSRNYSAFYLDTSTLNYATGTYNIGNYINNYENSFQTTPGNGSNYKMTLRSVGFVTPSVEYNEAKIEMQPHLITLKADSTSSSVLYANSSRMDIGIRNVRLRTDSLIFTGFGSGIHTGTPTHTLQVDASGNVIEGAIGGGGTVTDFSAGDLSPLFTTSEATTTTTPALTFSLSNAAAHKFFGNNTGSSGAPAYVSITTADLPSISSIEADPISIHLSGTSTLTGTTNIALASNPLNFQTTGGSLGRIDPTNRVIYWGDVFHDWNNTKVAIDDVNQIINLLSNKVTIQDGSLASASVGYVWKLQSTITGEGAWAAETGGSGETNTASNLGGGLANYSTKVGVDLRFNSFDAADFDLASNIISIDATKWLTISAAAAAYQPLDADLTTIAGLTATTDNFLVSVSSAWASRTPSQVRTTLGLVIGTNVQAYDADLDTWAGITPASGIGIFLATPSSANLATAVTDETGTGSLVFGTQPKITTGINDANNNELFLFTATGSAVNELTYANAATGTNPLWTASGGDADVGIDWKPKGAGKFRLLATTSGPAELRFFEDADNGTNYAGVIAPATLGSDITITLPNASSTLPIFGQQITFSGPTAARTVTFPDANFTAARTDAAQTFTGSQTFSQVLTTNNAITASGNAATVPVTSRVNTVTNNSAATLTITLTTTSAVDGQEVVVRILDASAVAQTITWVNTENSSIAAPTTSNGSTTLPLEVVFRYNNATSKWRTKSYN